MHSNRTVARRRPRIEQIRKLLALTPILVALATGTVAFAQDGPPGITVPRVFPPFDPGAPSCAAPPGLQKVLAFAQDNERDFMMGVGRGLAAAARDRGLGYRTVLAGNDPTKMIQQVRGLAAEKIGAVVAAPVDPLSLAHPLQELIWSGGYVGTVVPPPAVSLLNAPQYLTGKALGNAAAEYIRGPAGVEGPRWSSSRTMACSFSHRASSPCGTRCGEFLA